MCHTKMIFQAHDELVCAVCGDGANRQRQGSGRIMAGLVSSELPLLAEMGLGSNCTGMCFAQDARC